MHLAHTLKTTSSEQLENQDFYFLMIAFSSLLYDLALELTTDQP